MLALNGPESFNDTVFSLIQDDPDAVPADTQVERWIVQQEQEQQQAPDTQSLQSAIFLMKKSLGTNSVAAMASLGDEHVAVCRVSRKRKVTTVILNDQLKEVKTIPFAYSSGMVNVQKLDGEKLLVTPYIGSTHPGINILLGFQLSTVTTASVVYIEPATLGLRWTNICNIGYNRIACWNSGNRKEGTCISVDILDTSIDPFKCIDVFKISHEIQQVHDMCYLDETCFGPMLVMCSPYQQVVMAYSYPEGKLIWSLDKKLAKDLSYSNLQPYSICPGDKGTFFMVSPQHARVFMISFLYDDWNGYRVALECIQGEHLEMIKLHAPRLVRYNAGILYVIHRNSYFTNDFEITKFMFRTHSSSRVFLKIKI